MPRPGPYEGQRTLGLVVILSSKSDKRNLYKSVFEIKLSQTLRHIPIITYIHAIHANFPLRNGEKKKKKNGQFIKMSSAFFSKLGKKKKKVQKLLITRRPYTLTQRKKIL